MRVARRNERSGQRGAGLAGSRRGIAMIMVLVLTTVLGAIATDLQNETSVNLQLAANARDQLQAHFHAQSAVELELFFLRFQSQVKSMLNNIIPIPLFELSSYFVSSDTMKGIVARGATPDDNPPDPHSVDRLGGKSTLGKSRGPGSPLPMPKSASHRPGGTFDPDADGVSSDDLLDQGFGNFEGSFWVEEVVDENRKINLNMLDKPGAGPIAQLLLMGLIKDPKYDPLFETTGESRDPYRNRIDLIANITDWMDANDTIDPVSLITGETGSSATEDARYQHLPYGARYKPKNAQFTSLEELRLVPGVNDAFMNLFAPYLTVWTDSNTINMPTADDQMLRAVVFSMLAGLPGPGDEERFQELLKERNLLRAMPPPLNKLTAPVFGQLLLKVGFRIDPVKQAQIMGTTTSGATVLSWDDTSNVYKITAVGRVGDATATMTVVARVYGGQQTIFYWRED